MKKRIIVGISGASGAPLAINVLKILRDIPEAETHLIITDSGALTIRHECGMDIDEAARLADFIYPNESIWEKPASGSFKTCGMIVVPCSMKTLAGISSGYSDSLLLRACDVTIKEQRKLVLAVRESPLSPVHLRNMYELSKMGVMIMPPVMEFYSDARTREEAACRFAKRAVGVFFDSVTAGEWDGVCR